MGKRLLCIAMIAGAICAFTAQNLAAGEKITVLLDWFVNPDHGPLYVALEKGLFKKRGLDVDFQVPSNPNDPPKLVAAGKADIAVSYQPQHHLHVDQGLPLVRIGTLVSTPLMSFTSTSNSAPGLVNSARASSGVNRGLLLSFIFPFLLLASRGTESSHQRRIVQHIT